MLSSDSHLKHCIKRIVHPLSPCNENLLGH
jgi:hypothetical protein